MPKSLPTIVLDQTCASLFDQVSDLAPTYIFTRRSSFLTDPEVAVQELFEALSRHAASPPYMYVASSFAGFTALLFAQRHPAYVHSLVLVDSSHPRQSEVLLAALPADLPKAPEIEKFKEYIKGFGPAWQQSCEKLSHVDTIGDIPVVVLAAWNPDIPASISRAVKGEMIRQAHALQQEHADRSSRGELRVIDRAGHDIANEAPLAVVAAIKYLLLKYPGRARLSLGDSS